MLLFMLIVRREEGNWQASRGENDVVSFMFEWGEW